MRKTRKTTQFFGRKQDRTVESHRTRDSATATSTDGSVMRGLRIGDYTSLGCGHSPPLAITCPRRYRALNTVKRADGPSCWCVPGERDGDIIILALGVRLPRITFAPDFCASLDSFLLMSNRRNNRSGAAVMYFFLGRTDSRLLFSVSSEKTRRKKTVERKRIEFRRVECATSVNTREMNEQTSSEWMSGYLARIKWRDYII